MRHIGSTITRCQVLTVVATDAGSSFLKAPDDDWDQVFVAGVKLLDEI